LRRHHRFLHGPLSLRDQSYLFNYRDEDMNSSRRRNRDVEDVERPQRQEVESAVGATHERWWRDVESGGLVVIRVVADLGKLCDEGGVALQQPRDLLQSVDNRGMVAVSKEKANLLEG
jgi:hypothetical protein